MNNFSKYFSWLLLNWNSRITTSQSVKYREIHITFHVMKYSFVSESCTANKIKNERAISLKRTQLYIRFRSNVKQSILAGHLRTEKTRLLREIKITVRITKHVLHTCSLFIEAWWIFIKCYFWFFPWLVQNISNMAFFFNGRVW